MKNIKTFNQLFESDAASQTGGVVAINMHYSIPGVDDVHEGEFGTYAFCLSDPSQYVLVEDTEGDGIIEEWASGLVPQALEELFGSGPYTIENMLSEEMAEALSLMYADIAGDDEAKVEIFVTPIPMSEADFEAGLDNPEALGREIASLEGNKSPEVWEPVWNELPEEYKLYAYSPQFSWVDAEEGRKLQALQTYRNIKNLL